MYNIDGQEKLFKKHWALPLIERFDHRNGITPYSGIVPVTENSYLVPPDILTPELTDLIEACEKAASILQCKGLIRIDARAGSDGKCRLFDINMKPNMTGCGRPNRDNQNSLTAIAAENINWNYNSLVQNIANQEWKLDI